MVLQGKDAWGHSLFYTVDESRMTAVVRSMGPNGMDDAGREDDIVRIISLDGITQMNGCETHEAD